MNWEKVSLESISIRIGDGLHGTPKYDDSGEFYFINGNNLSEGKILIKEDTKRISSIEYDKIKKDLSEKTVLVAINGTLGNVGLYRDEPVALGKSACYINVNDKAEKLFVRYVLENEDFQRYARDFATGSTIKNLGLKAVRDYSFNLPPLPTQRKIASILSAYDDLIENNLKRIKLMEEKAQLHYKELMQEMSYSKTKREEYIKDCLAFYIGGGWGEEDYKEKFTEPAYVIRGTDIPDTRGGNVSGIPLRFHKASNLESRKMQIGDIVFEISNGQINNIGRTVLISKRLLGQFDQPVMCASFAKLIRVNEKLSPEFFYLYLNEGQENGLLYQYKSNSANGINNFAFETFIDEVKITIPKETELKAFTEKVKPIFTLISTLGEQNSKLREARDILLPKLMNGQIEV